jgi:antitoxin component of MazEF toxin-antitoxin module
MDKYIHKINGKIGKSSLSVILPKNFLTDLAITKGNFVQIQKEKDEIIIKKLIDSDTNSIQKQTNEDNLSENKSVLKIQDNLRKNKSNMLPVEQPGKLSTGISH